MSEFSGIRRAARTLSLCSVDERTQALEALAQGILAAQEKLIEASQLDIEEHGSSLSNASRARLELSPAKVNQIAISIRQVAALPDPIGTVQQRTLLDDGLELERITIPLGVFGVIFESRADVAPQILSLALRSGNGVILKGGSETRRINSLYAEIAENISTRVPAIPPGWFEMHHDRDVVARMLNAPGEIDLIIPRGSNELVQSIMKASKVPVLGHADGVCHILVDRDADIQTALDVILDAKTQYPAACNTVETVLIDAAVAEEFLPLLVAAAERSKIELRGGTALRAHLPKAPAIIGDDWHTEYGDLILAVEVVDNCEAGIDHINCHGSHHTDCILTNNKTTAEKFLAKVDSANVYVNCSTRFADGFRYGFGAEIGIGTGRIHARGPVGIEGLLTYKYVLRGNGQTVKQYTGDSARQFKHQKLM